MANRTISFALNMQCFLDRNFQLRIEEIGCFLGCEYKFGWDVNDVAGWTPFHYIYWTNLCSVQEQ